MGVYASAKGSESNLPPFLLVNRFSLAEAARMVYFNAKAMIADAEYRDLSVHSLEIGGTPYVAVLGNEPEAGIRYQLVRLFSMGGIPDELPENVILRLSRSRSRQPTVRRA